MAKEKLTQEELQEDALVTAYDRVLSYIEQNKSTVYGAVGAFLLLIALLIGYTFYSDSQEAKAAELLAVAESQFSKGEYEKALNGSEFDYTLGFIQIINRFSGTKAGNLAVYYAALSEYNLGNNEEALAYIRKYKHTSGILGVPSITMEAVILANLGQFDASAKMYEKAAKWVDNDQTTPTAYLDAARMYVKAGDNAKAKTLVSLVIGKYENSSIVAEAQRVEGMIGA